MDGGKQDHDWWWLVRAGNGASGTWLVAIVLVEMDPSSILARKPYSEKRKGQESNRAEILGLLVLCRES